VTAHGPARPAPHLRSSRFYLDVTPPFRLDLTVWALRRRPHNAIDAWDGAQWQRTVLLGTEPVEVSVRQVATRPSCRLEVRLRAGSPARGQVAQARSWLDRSYGPFSRINLP